MAMNKQTHKYTSKKMTINQYNSVEKTPCKCGSKSHSRSNHKDCPLNKSPNNHVCSSKCKKNKFDECIELQKKRNNLLKSRGF